MLVNLLSSAQQEELASAFRQFDIDSSGAMCVPPSPRCTVLPPQPRRAVSACHALRASLTVLVSRARSDRKELMLVLGQLGMNPLDEAVRAIIASLDVDGNGKIEWAEFSALMADRWLGQEVRATRASVPRPRALARSAPQLSRAVRARYRPRLQGRVDIEHAANLFNPSGGNGMLNIAQMRSYLSGMGERPMTAPELAEFVRMADPHGTGMVSMEDFLALPCWEPPDMEQLRQMSDARQAEADRLATVPVAQLAPGSR